MEWVETTGRSIDEAKDAALDQLGVDADDAEFTVVQDAKLGLFGRVREEARVRARVKPTKPRSKDEARDRRRRQRRHEGRDEGRESSAEPRSSGPAKAKARTPSAAKAAAPEAAGRGGAGEPGEGRRRRGRAQSNKEKAADQAESRTQDAPKGRGNDSQQDAGAASATVPAAAVGAEPRKSSTRSPDLRDFGSVRDVEENDRSDDDLWDEGEAMTDVAMAEQGEVARVFLSGLLAAFGAPSSIAIRDVGDAEDEMIELAVTGQDLGLLIGPKGATLAAVQDLVRTAVQRKTGARNGRILVDVAGYRQKRKIALERFTRQVADDVVASGTRKALEPMAPADRKIVHDTANDIPGVTTTSEGEEPRRRVIIMPVGTSA